MKRYTILILSIAICTSSSLAQHFPTGGWTVITDANGTPINVKNAGPRNVTNFNFQDGKYSFSLERLDSFGRKTMAIKENGVYSVSATQLMLTPKASTTSFYDYLPQSGKPVGNSTKQNPLSTASYNWEYQKGKAETLTIEAIRPGHREGVISGNAKALRPLPADVRRSLARSL